MARIRSIKPEFPQSETMGKLSRDARLLFIQLWTIVDDEGRARAASRMLASLLYPYDDDAPRLIDGWMAELEANGCVRRYEIDGSRYLDIPNWLKHQKIDRPTPSRLPAFPDTLASPREPSRALDADLGPRTLDQDQGVGGSAPAREPPSLISPEAAAVAEEVMAIAGVDREFIPPGWCGAPARVQVMLAQGWARETILAGARRGMANKRDGPPDSIAYLEKPIAREHAAIGKPLPVATAKPKAAYERRDEPPNYRDLAEAIIERTRAAECGASAGLLPAGGGNVAVLLPKGRSS